MIARVAIWEPMPDDDRQWVIDAAKTVPGVLDAYHLIDPVTGNGLSVAFFDDSVDAVGRQGRHRRQGQRDRLERRPTARSEVRDDLHGAPQPLA